MTITKAIPKVGGKKMLDHVRIDPSDNGGFTVHSHFKSPNPTRNAPYMPPPEPESNVFENHAAMLAHVGKVFGAPKVVAPKTAKPAMVADTDNDGD
jgi:hypothetical protein